MHAENSGPTSAGPPANRWERFKRSLPSRDFWTAVGALAAVVAAIATAIGVFIAIRTLDHGNDLQKKNNRLQAAQLDAHLEEGMIQLDKYFSSEPALRPFFFGGQHVESSRLVRARAEGAAEMLIDFADDVGAYARMGRMSKDSERRWATIIRLYFQQSPITRRVWDEAYVAYDRVTACFLGAPDGQAVNGWSWRSDSPTVFLPETCS
jgi:hypothetical protein